MSQFLENIREVMHKANHPVSTQDAYVGHIRRFILFHGKRHPREMGDAEVSAFLSHLAADRSLTAADRDQATDALAFLYQKILKTELKDFGNMEMDRFIGHMREIMCKKHYSIHTEKAYVDWTRQFIIFHGRCHPREMGEIHISEFLSHLAVNRNVAASTQNQALNALVFLYKRVLKIEMGDFGQIERAKRPENLPTVMSQNEVARVLKLMSGRHALMAKLLYGCGLRIRECVRLRAKDVDFEQNQVIVRSGKGMKDRSVMLPEQLKTPIRDQLEVARNIHQQDLRKGLGEVHMPFALGRKYSGSDWIWQYAFPSDRISKDPRSGKMRRHHLDESGLRKAVKRAVTKAEITKKVGPHTFRHSFATHLLEAGYDIRTIQELMGHKDVSTTMVYLHVMNKGGMGVRSPLDKLLEGG